MSAPSHEAIPSKLLHYIYIDNVFYYAHCNALLDINDDDDDDDDDDVDDCFLVVNAFSLTDTMSSSRPLSLCSSITEIELRKTCTFGKKQKAEKQISCLVSQMGALLFINGNIQFLLTSQFFTRLMRRK